MPLHRSQTRYLFTAAGPNQEHVRQNTYYIRRSGLQSGPPESGREWDELIGRCAMAARDDLPERTRGILQGFGGIQRVEFAEEKKSEFENWVDASIARFNSLVAQKLSNETPSRYSKGTWHVAYSIPGDLRSPSLPDLLEILRKVKGHETGCPWWVPTRDEIASYPYEGVVECWLRETRSDLLFGEPRSDNFRFTASSDFWRASPKGMMFLLRGYQEDGSPRIEPGTIANVTLLIWRAGECLLHAQRLAIALGGRSTSVVIRVTWRGLLGRTLASWANSRRMFLLPDSPSRQDSVTPEITVSTEQISATLPEIVRPLTAPFYEVFGFFVMPSNVIQEELSNMRSRVSYTPS